MTKMVISQIEPEKVVGFIVVPIRTPAQSANDLEIRIQQRRARAAERCVALRPLIYFPMSKGNGIVKSTKSRERWFRYAK